MCVFHVHLVPPIAKIRHLHPSGDGCKDAERWVRDILNPPPPNPNAPKRKPKPPLTLARLPQQCVGVLQSN
jgi:penicillin-insensitive murein endopeptidase